MTGATLSRRAARIEKQQRRARARAVADRDADVVPLPDRSRRAAQHAGRRAETTPTTACSGSSSAASRPRDRSLARGTNTASRRTPSSQACRKWWAAGWQSGPGPASSCRRRERQQADQHRQAHRAGNIRLMHADSLDARNFHGQARGRAVRAASTRVSQGKWSDGSPSGRLHANGLLEAVRRGNPAIRERCGQRVRGPEALRHRLSTVLPLVRRCAVCRRRAT